MTIKSILEKYPTINPDEKRQISITVPRRYESNNNVIMNPDGSANTVTIEDNYSFSDVMSADSTLDNILSSGTNYVDMSIKAGPTKIFVAKKIEHANGKVTEEKAPKPNAEYDIPYSNRPTLPPSALGEVSLKTILGKTNAKLHHECDFTIGLKQEVCGVTIEAFSKNIKLVLEANLQALLEAQIPFLGHILNIFKTLKSWFDTIMSYIKKIEMFIKCMSDLVKAIMSFINQLATLPARILNQITGCVSGLRNLLTNTVDNMLNHGIMEKMSKGVSDMVNQVNTSKNNIIGSISSASKSVTNTMKGDSITKTYDSSLKGFQGEMKNVTKPKLKVNDLNDYIKMSNVSALNTEFKLP